MGAFVPQTSSRDWNKPRREIRRKKFLRKIFLKRDRFSETGGLEAPE
jgi:hypothetical protein